MPRAVSTWGKLLGAFQAFFREHSEHWLGRFDYVGAGPQLVLQAFLQRVVNNGGRIEREYGLGRGAHGPADSCGRGAGASGKAHPDPCPLTSTCRMQGAAEEPREATLREGLEQTAGYMDRCGSREGHLVIFDRSEGKAWEEKIFRREESSSGGRTTHRVGGVRARDDRP